MYKSSINKYFLLFSAVLILTAAVMAPPTLSAMPANPFPETAEQADGTKIVLFGRGDEFLNWTEDGEGYAIAYDPDSGNWNYALLDGGRIVPGPDTAGRERPSGHPLRRAKGRDLAKHAAPSRRNSPVQNDSQLPPSISSAPPLSKTSPVKSSQRIILLLIEFDDVSITETEGYWHGMYFDTSPGVKSVADYYKTMSGGSDIFIPAETKTAVTTTATYSVSFSYSAAAWARSPVNATVSKSIYDGVVKVKLGRNHPIPTYDAEPSRDNFERAVIELSVMAISDNTGFIFGGDDLHIAAVIAGYDRSAGTSGNGRGQVWAHKWSFDDRVITGNAVRNGWVTYMLHGEMFNSSNRMAIGVSCHELGHTLGLPDLYDTTEVSEGLGPYSLMASGGWGAASGETVSGMTPVSLDAWSRIELGYITPETVTYDQYRKLNIKNINNPDPEAFEALKITNAAQSPTQYFLAENRVMSEYDEGLVRFGFSAAVNNNGGILIYHVDEAMKDGDGMLTNDNKNHKAVDAEEADGSTVLESPISVSTDFGLYCHFFTNGAYTAQTSSRKVHGGVSGTFSSFGPATSPNSNFYVSPANHSQTVITDINITVNSPRGNIMEVEAGIRPPAEATPEADINYADETLTGLISGGTYTVNGSPAALSGTSCAIQAGWFGKGVSVVKKGDNVNTSDSDAQVLSVPARPPAPAPGKTDCTFGENDGMLTGLIAGKIYEYSGGGGFVTAAADGGGNITGLSAGTYVLRVKSVPGASFKSANSVAVVIGVNLPPEPKPDISIDYYNAALTGFFAGANYSFNGAAETVPGTSRDIASDWFGDSLFIVRKGDGTATADSEVQDLYISPRPAVPEPGKVDCASPSDNDGMITGLLPGVLYEIETNGGGYEDVTPDGSGRITGLFPGIYTVRIKAEIDVFASAPSPVIRIYKFGAVPEDTPGARIDYSEETFCGLAAGGIYSFNGMDETVLAGTDFPILPEWFGLSVSIIKRGDIAETCDSEPQVLAVPLRPPAPSPGKLDCSSVANCDGAITGLVPGVTYEYRTDGPGAPYIPAEAGSDGMVAGFGPGTYTVRLKAVHDAFFASDDSEAVTVLAYSLIPEETPNISIDFINENMTGFIEGAAYYFNGVLKTSAAYAIMAIRAEWFGSAVSIVRKGDGAMTSDSTAQSLTIPARRAAPGPAPVNCSSPDMADGAITGVSNQMEYCGEGGWTDCGGKTVNGLSAGTYLIRYKADEDKFCGEIACVTVGSDPYPEILDAVTNGDSLTVSLIPPKQKNAVIIAAFYKNGKLVDTKRETVQLRDTVSFGGCASEFDSFKIMLWDGAGTMRPLCGSFPVSL